MKFFIAFAALCLVGASAGVVPHPQPVPPYDLSGVDIDISDLPVIEGPFDVIPIAVVEPAVEDELSPIAVGPEIIDFPLPDGGAVTAEDPAPAPVVVEPSPVVIGEIPAGASPLVQIIVNVKAPECLPVFPEPADNAVVDEVYVPGPVNIVDDVYAPDVIIEPIQVVQPIIPGPINVVDNVVVEPIQVVEPVVVEPVIVGTPIVPGTVNVVDNVVVEPIQVVEPVVVEPVIVDSPVIPVPAVVIPDILN